MDRSLWLGKLCFSHVPIVVVRCIRRMSWSVQCVPACTCHERVCIDLYPLRDAIHCGTRSCPAMGWPRHNHVMNAQPLILVVDDDREIRSLLSEYLAANGFRTVEAADGAAMWKALDAARIDLIVLDLMMPGEDGLQLCRTLRARSNLPVIMLTARGQA